MDFLCFCLLWESFGICAFWRFRSVFFPFPSYQVQLSCVHIYVRWELTSTKGLSERKVHVYVVIRKLPFVKYTPWNALTGLKRSYIYIYFFLKSSYTFWAWSVDSKLLLRETFAISSIVNRFLLVENSVCFCIHRQFNLIHVNFLALFGFILSIVRDANFKSQEITQYQKKCCCTNKTFT